MDDLLESLQPQGSLAASPEAAEPAEPEPTETETFESLLAEISESPDTHAAPKSAGQAPPWSDRPNVCHEHSGLGRGTSGGTEPSCRRITAVVVHVG